MKGIKAIFVASLALMVAAGTEKKQFKEHLDRVWNFRCKDPQKRAISLSSLKSLPTDEVYFPEVTVLHRCDMGAGRCPQGEGYGCGPAETEEVPLVFRVTRGLAGPVNPRNPGIRYETIMLTNHTLCECQALADLPK